MLVLLGSIAPVPLEAASLTVHLAVVYIAPLGDAYRASQVTNDSNDKIGTIDASLITPNDRGVLAVLSAGGFLGVGRHLVVVPYSSLNLDKRHNRIVLAGASKDELKKLTEFHCAT
jgi:hypothetical protein